MPVGPRLAKLGCDGIASGEKRFLGLSSAHGEGEQGENQFMLFPWDAPGQSKGPGEFSPGPRFSLSSRPNTRRHPLRPLPRLVAAVVPHPLV